MIEEKDDEPTCRACRHFHTNPQDITVGDCFRNPPVPYPMQNGIMNVTPIVQGMRPACGEFKKRKELSLVSD